MNRSSRILSGRLTGIHGHGSVPILSLVLVTLGTQYTGPAFEWRMCDFQPTSQFPLVQLVQARYSISLTCANGSDKADNLKVRSEIMKSGSEDATRVKCSNRSI